MKRPRTTEPELGPRVDDAPGGLASTPVSTCLRRHADVVHADTDEDTLADLMCERGLDALPVVDGGGRLLGMVTARDLLRARLSWSSEPDGRRLPRGFHAEDPPRPVLVDMELAPVVLREDDTLARALLLMAARGVDLAPVVDGGRRVRGVLHAADAVAWLLERGGLPALCAAGTADAAVEPHSGRSRTRSS